MVNPDGSINEDATTGKYPLFYTLAQHTNSSSLISSL
jgi:hypothetical protein